MLTLPLAIIAYGYLYLDLIKEVLPKSSIYYQLNNFCSHDYISPCIDTTTNMWGLIDKYG